MSITDELREWGGTGNSQFARHVQDIADRIDAEHARIVRQKVNKAHADGEQSAIRQLRSASKDHRRGYQLGHKEAMQEVQRTHVALPLDANGMPIHVGDVMEERSGHTFEVASLMAFGGTDNWLVLSNPRNFSSFREPHDIRHYKPPTVEDVLRDMHMKLDEVTALYVGEAIDSDERDRDEARIFAEYASKLQLKEDA